LKKLYRFKKDFIGGVAEDTMAWSRAIPVLLASTITTTIQASQKESETNLRFSSTNNEED